MTYKGNHERQRASQKTILKDRKKEIGPGLLRKMIAELRLDKKDMK